MNFLCIIGSIMYIVTAMNLLSWLSYCTCHKGTHLIMGAIMLNGVACGMIYRPLPATTRRTDVGPLASHRIRLLAAADHNAFGEKQCTEPAFASSLSDWTVTKSSHCPIDMQVADVPSQSLHAVSGVTNSVTEVYSVARLRLIWCCL